MIKNQRFDFSQPFRAYIEGNELQNINAVQITRNCAENNNADQNKVTFYYTQGKAQCVMTIELDAVQFVNC